MEDLVVAYRKAKVDIFQNSHPRRHDLVEYEESLSARLQSLLTRVNSSDMSWTSDEEYLGTFTFTPKALSFKAEKRNTFWSDPTKAWDHVAKSSKTTPVVDFRLVSSCSIDFHILSSLWILRVGTQLDGALSSAARGSRLRRGPNDEPNRLSPGSFEHYPSAFQKWRDDGLHTMRSRVIEGTSIIAVTADATAFYHRLDSRFLTDSTFIETRLGVDLTDEQRHLTAIFVESLNSWSNLVTRVMNSDGATDSWPHSGLPVGVAASAVVANLALYELDEFFESLQPEFYGRYVDDITLVFEDEGSIRDQQDLWNWLSARSNGLLQMATERRDAHADAEPSTSLIMRSKYLRGSRIEFSNSKNKLFHLAGPAGLAVIDSIRATIRERSSEWRSLANVPVDPTDIEVAVTTVASADGDAVENLRDTDELSGRKAAFAIRLRDLEDYGHALAPKEWTQQRYEFVRVTCDRMLSLPAFIDFSVYLRRLITLAARAEDERSLDRIFRSVVQLPTLLSDTCDVRAAGLTGEPSDGQRLVMLEAWRHALARECLEAFTAGWMGPISSARTRRLFTRFKYLSREIADILASPAELRAWNTRMGSRDLADMPYKQSLTPEHDGRRFPTSYYEGSGVPEEVVDAIQNLEPHVTRDDDLFFLFRSESIDAGLAFSTRPVDLFDLTLEFLRRPSNRFGIPDPDTVASILLGFRGFVPKDLPSVDAAYSDRPEYIQVPAEGQRSTISIALAMLATSVDDAVAAADGKPNLTAQRYEALKTLLKHVGDSARRVDYALLPELSVPPKWFKRFAIGLQRSHINLIAGVEHQPVQTDKARNQVWAALGTSRRYGQMYLYKQDKQRAALPETRAVLRPVGRELGPQVEWENPPVLMHGIFAFALLVCSEFTNINYRAHLRGAVDAILVPEWNQDLHTFEALVESAALDVHAYVAQANSRGFGDTRLRAPMSEPWARDVVRLKGGLEDYFVIGEIDVDSLRRAHNGRPLLPSVKASGSGSEFKPVPDGFDPDPRRPVL